MHDKARRGRSVTAVMLATIFLITFVSVAYASGNFTWTAYFSANLRSRDYATPNTGTHSVKSNISNYGDPSGANSYTVQVWRNINNWPDHNYGSKTYYCNYSQTKSWSVADTGTFYFVLGKPVNGFYWSGSGQTWYP